VGQDHGVSQSRDVSQSNPQCQNKVNVMCLCGELGSEACDKASVVRGHAGQIADGTLALVGATRVHGGVDWINAKKRILA